MLQIKFSHSAWGLCGWNDYDALPDVLRRVRDAGFDAMEMWAPDNDKDRDRLRGWLGDLGLGHTVGCGSSGATVEEHLKTIESAARDAAAAGAWAAAMHSGSDLFSHEDNLRIVQRVVELEDELGIKLCHETHRQRMCYAATTTEKLLDAEPRMRLNADFSHWCCVHETLLENQTERVSKAVARTFHVHARVGHAEAPQVTDPRSKENKAALDAHLAWWDAIVEARRADGTERLVICPECGPPPYMPLIPHTDKPVGDLFEINTWMMKLLRDRYGA